MTRAHLTRLTLAVGILSVAGCGSSEPGGATTGASGSGGSVSTGGAQAPGGTTGGTGNSGTGGAGGSSTGGSGAGTGNTGGSVSVGGRGGTTGAGGVSTTGGTGGGSAGRGGVSGTAGAGGSDAPGAGGAGGSLGTGATGGGSAGSSGGGRGGTSAGGRGGGLGGAAAGSSGSAGRGGTGGTSSGTCTASKGAGANASGTGPHKVTVETNSDAGISEGTIFRPTDLGGTEKYPIFVWGEGGCSLNGLSNSAAMGEIASHGYFVIADGTPNGSNSRSMNTSDIAGMGKPLLAYVAWAVAENDKPCSAYYQSLDTTKIASNGFSCGGLMAEGTAGDPRITTWGLNSSGLFSADQAFYKTVHTPVLIVLGGSGDIAYDNGERDYTNLAALGIPIMLFSKALGHGGDLFSSHGGDFTKIDLAWLNWQLKGDTTATGKGLLIGSGCTYCKDSAWEVKSMNIQ
jgi:dienelactone hydrolase